MVGWSIKWFSSLVISIITIKAYAEQPDLYFKRLSKENGLSHNKVNCILQDQRGFTWIGTDDGLNRYDGNNFFVYKNTPGNSLSVSGNTITDIHEDKQGVLWIATADGGLTRYDYRLAPSKQFRHFKHNPSNKNSIPVNIINAIAEDQHGYLWLATGGAALLRFDKQKEVFATLNGAGAWTIYDLCFDSKGMIWAGKEGGSILKVNPSTLKWETDPKYDNLYASLPHVVVTSLFRDRKDNIWFGSWDKAVYRYNNKTQQEESFVGATNLPYSFGKDEATAFNEDKDGRIWIGGKYSGLYIYNPQSNSFYNYRYDPAKEGSLSNNKVNCIYVDKSGMIWIGTNKGISLYEASKQKLRQRFLPINNNQDELIIYDFHKAGNNELWIGTNNGLYIENNGVYQQ
ncbi:MAG TPA: two-component regulator propeller domain-containing protein, partial [Chitinophagaceae bacterium]